MAVKKRNGSPDEDGEKGAYPIRCRTCKKDLRQEGWKSGPVVHCEGAAPQTFGIWQNSRHHGHRAVICPKCRRRLGCDGCAPKPENVICERCHVSAGGELMMASEQTKQNVRALIEAL